MFNAVWVEIPVKDLERATKFYETVFQLPPGEAVDDGERKTRTLYGGTAEGIAGISLNQTANFEPGDKGVYVYLNTGDDLTPHLARIELVGGKVLTPKTSMGSAGSFASFLDTEGNLLGLYSYP